MMLLLVLSTIVGLFFPPALMLTLALAYIMVRDAYRERHIQRELSRNDQIKSAAKFFRS